MLFVSQSNSRIAGRKHEVGGTGGNNPAISARPAAGDTTQLISAGKKGDRCRTGCRMHVVQELVGGARQRSSGIRGEFTGRIGEAEFAAGCCVPFQRNRSACTEGQLGRLDIQYITRFGRLFYRPARTGGELGRIRCGADKGRICILCANSDGSSGGRPCA